MKIAILTNCTATSTQITVPELDGAVLGDGYTHKQAAEEWHKRILAAENVHERVKVRSLYSGISFRTILHASDFIKDSKPDIFVVSLGAGFVSAEDKIMSYNLNILPGDMSKSSLNNIVTDEVFDPIRWWESINYELSKVGNPITKLIESDAYDLILIALSNNFLGLVSADIAGAIQLPNFNKIRVIGPKQTLNNFKYVRHFAKHGVVLPYGNKLNKLLPGNRNDFAQRAGIHFIREILIKHDYNMDLALHVNEVEKAMIDVVDVDKGEHIKYIKELSADASITEANTAYNLFTKKFAGEVEFARFKVLWETQKDIIFSEDTLANALAVMDTLSIAGNDIHKEDAIPGLKLFIHVFKARGGGAFAVKDICNWAKLYYDRIDEDMPIIFKSPGKLGRLLPTISNELNIRKTTANALTGNKYELS